MQISRHLLMTCAVAAFLTPTLAHAADNEAKIRARQALEDKMKQIDAQTPPATSVPPAVATPQPSPKPAPPAPPAPAVSARSTNNAGNDKLSEALHQKMRETESEPVATPAPPQPPEKPKKIAPPVVVKAPPVQPSITVTKPAVPAPAAPAPAVSARSTDNAANDKLNEALHQKMRETESEPVAMPAPPQPPEKPKKIAPPVLVKAPQVQPSITVTKPAAPTPAAPPAPTFAPIPTTSNTVRATLPEKPTPPTVSTPTYAPIPESSYTVHPALPQIPTPAPAPAANQIQAAPPMISLPPMAAPPSSLSAAKQQKLDALLQQYRMDQLTPQQYHEQRAKILSEP